MSNNKPLPIEAWHFLKARKAWWLTPIIIMLIFVGFINHILKEKINSF